MSRKQVLDSLARYAALREHHDAAFAGRLEQLRAWQATRVCDRHPQVLADPHAGRLLDFFIEEFYCGVDLSELTDDVEDATARIDRLLPDTRAAGAALELIALSGELDQAMCEELGAECGQDLSPVRYVRAYHEVGRREDRQRVLDLIDHICAQLGGFARSRLAFMAFKLAGRPARKARLGSLYDLIAGAFEAARRVKDLQGLVEQILAVERDRVDRLLL